MEQEAFQHQLIAILSLEDPLTRALMAAAAKAQQRHRPRPLCDLSNRNRNRMRSNKLNNNSRPIRPQLPRTGTRPTPSLRHKAEEAQDGLAFLGCRCGEQRQGKVSPSLKESDVEIYKYFISSHLSKEQRSFLQRATTCAICFKATLA